MEKFSTTPLKRSVGFRRAGQRSRKKARAAVDLAILAFNNLITSATSKWIFTPAQACQFDALQGLKMVGEWPLLSDLEARQRASYILIRLMAKHWQKRLKAPARRYYFLTFIDDLGNTSDRTPQVNLPAIQSKVDKAMRALGLDGVGLIEVQALMNYPGRGRGRTLLFHAHAIAWTTDPRFSPKAAEAQINGSRSWSNSFGARPLRVKPMTNEKGQIDYLAYYSLKVPSDAKNRMPDHKKPGRHILMSTTKGYRPELALRIFEWLSQTKLPDVMFGVGEGTAIRTQWRSKLINWHRHRLRQAEAEPPFDAAAFWRDVRRVNGSQNFEPYQVLAGHERPASVHLDPVDSSAADRSSSGTCKPDGDRTGSCLLA